ncbi:hypothetical protein CY34DRAFT_798067 [Suillus luteus UH-Slu-Lm8-n1]|uniref:Uncharacterized protein n=1 Tax=Suillus luteus UH-Slu-Lm8-n1 TaxID=930992 RepID=A0A0D0BSD1_9AGAM|nr:hypothetical protein CY34DRAFT_798067 [Suillus luteus UH-Slu-Lm8-n1]
MINHPYGASSSYMYANVSLRMIVIVNRPMFRPTQIASIVSCRGYQPIPCPGTGQPSTWVQPQI